MKLWHPRPAPAVPAGEKGRSPERNMAVKHSIGSAGAALLVAVVLSACGGGGGGGGGIPILPIAPAPGPVVPGQKITLSGQATYDAVPATTNGGLDYAGTARKPIRGAVVEIVSDAGAVLASGATDAQGNYSIGDLPAGTSVQLRIKAQLLRTGTGPAWDASVRDNTAQGALYAAVTPAFTLAGPAATRNLHAPSGWNGTRYSSAQARVAAPFAILDTVYTAQAKVLSVAPATHFPPLLLYWSPDNAPADGDVRLGQIGTTHFNPQGSAIFVLGREDSDTDEYDDSVIAHEWGHYYQAAFSRDDSIGGMHGRNDALDMRVAFSEGWGNGWAGIALDRRTYTDSNAAGQRGGLAFALDAGATDRPGWYSEFSIQYLFWALHAQAGFAPIHETMIHPAFKAGTPLTSVHAFAQVLRAHAPAAGSQFDQLLGTQAIRPGLDGFGTGETNEAGDPQVLPIYAQATVGVPAQACVSNAFDPYGEGNKLRGHAYLRFAAPAAGRYTVGVDNGSPGALPAFRLYRGALLAAVEGSDAPQAAGSFDLAAGEHVLVVRNVQNAGACFRVTIQQ